MLRHLKCWAAGTLLVTALAESIACASAPSPESAPEVAEASLPRAADNPDLAASTVITRFAVGSCNRQDQSQAYWPTLAAADPQLFLMIGDNVYGDTGWDGAPSLASFIAAYRLQAGHDEFTRFRSRQDHSFAEKVLSAMRFQFGGHVESKP